MKAVGGPDGQRGWWKVRTIDIGGYETVISRKVLFTFGTGDLTRGCMNAQLLIVPIVRPAYGGCLSSESYIRLHSAVYTLIACDFGDLD